MVEIIGCGEAFDSQLGNNSCLLFQNKRPFLLIDCGYQVPERIWRTIRRYQDLQGVYLTHTHADHAFGIAPLLVRFWEEKRQDPFLIMGPKGIQSYVRKLMNLAYPSALKRLEFQIEYVELTSGDQWQWGNYRFQCARSKHSVLNLALRIWNSKGRSIGISGDGQLTSETKKLFHDVDILFHEVYEQRDRIPNHCNLESIINYSRNAKIGRIVLNHLSRQERSAIEKKLPNIAKRFQFTKWQIGVPGDQFSF